MKKIFVSSTFKDMNFERDTLMQLVMPQLNLIARDYGESISFCDLRWGVNTGELESEDGAKKVLSVCLNEIDNCAPYMIVILGERYGWIPNEKLIADAVETRKDFSLEELEKSVTALEIEYGALNNPEQLKRTLFYFREFQGDIPDDYNKEDEYHHRKLTELKERIRSITGGKIKSYKVCWNTKENILEGMDDFAQMVISDIYAMLKDEWKELAKLTPYEKDLRVKWEFVREKSSQFKVRENLVQECIQLLNKENYNLALKGDSGCGKTTLMCRLALTLEEAGNDVLPIMCGSNSLCDTTDGIERYIVEYLETKLGWEHYADELKKEREKETEKQRERKQENWRIRLDDLIDAYEKKGQKRLYILADGVEQISAKEDDDKLRFIRTKKLNYCRYIVSCPKEFKTIGMNKKDISPLQENERRSIIHGMLYGTNKELDEAVICAMTQKKVADNPLYLSLLLQRLLMMSQEDFNLINAQGGTMDEITRYQVRLVENAADSLDELCVEILLEASKQVGGELARNVVELLSVSRYGLREQDLSGVFQQMGKEWNSLDFSRFLSYMNIFFRQREDGRYDFTNKNFREGFLKHCENVEEVHKALLAYWDTLAIRDEVREKEYVYHCILANEKLRYVRYLKELYPYEEEAAKDTMLLIRRDGGAWFSHLLEKGEENGVDSCFICNFVLCKLNREFSLLKEDSFQTQKIIYEKLVVLVERLARDYGSEENYECLAQCLEKVSDFYRHLTSKDDLRRALTLVLRLSEIQNRWIRTSALFAEAEKILDTYRYICDIYIQLKEEEAMYQAVKLHEDVLKNIETAKFYRSYIESSFSLEANVYGCLGDVYFALGDHENRDKALKFHQKECALYEQFQEEKGTDTNLKKLAASYESCGKIYTLLGGEENLRMAIHLYEKALKIIEQMQVKKGLSGELEELLSLVFSPNNPSSRCKSYLTIGNLYETLGGREDIEKAIALYKKEHAINLKIGGYPVLDSFWRLESCYIKLNDNESLQKALELFQENIRYHLQLSSCSDQKRIVLNGVKCRNQMGRIYEKMGKIQDANAQYEIELSIRKRMAIESKKDNDVQEALLEVLHRVAMHPATIPERREECLKQLREILKKFSQEDNSEKYQIYRDSCNEFLGEEKQEKKHKSFFDKLNAIWRK